VFGISTTLGMLVERMVLVTNHAINMDQ